MFKKILFGFVLAGALCVPGHARVDEVTYMKNGAYIGKIGSYLLNETLYLDAAKAAKLMGGKIYWYPVSGKLMLQNKGSKTVFFMKSDEVMINDVKVSIPSPMIVRGGKAFLAMDFFVSRHFAKTFGFKLSYNDTTGVLTAQQKINISSINYFSYPDKTRVVVYMEEPLEYQTSPKENLYSVTIPNGVLEGEDNVAIADGVIKSVDMFQENKMARIVLTPDDNFGRVNAFKLSGPDRIVFDVEKDIRPVAQSINGVTAAAPDAAVIIPSVLTDTHTQVQVSTDALIIEPTGPALLATDVTDIQVNIPDKIILDHGGRKRVVIDAGHGGKDSGGKKAFGLREKEINLLLAKDLEKLLGEEEIFDVLMTRTSDVFIPLNDRSAVANNFNADIFISIHANASRDRRERGFEVYFMSENASDPWAAEVADYENSVIGLEEGAGQGDPTALLLHSLARNEYVNEGSRLAGLISKEIERSTPFENRGVKQAAFYVLRGTYAPGVLIEAGFMTNSRDQKDLNDKKVRSKLANAVYKGIMKYAQMKKWK